jgi:ABC-type glycerol-3-phosphate transport system substrate-binding protein
MHRPQLALPAALRLLRLWLAAGLLLSACAAPAPTPTPRTPQPAPPTNGVTPTPPAPPPAELRATLAIWHALADPDRPRLAELIAGFQEDYPNVQFDVTYIPPADLLARYLTAVREGAGPSLLLAPAASTAALQDGAAIEDLRPLLSVALRERLPANLTSPGSERPIWSLPYAMEGVILYRNRRLIDAAAATWEELVSRAQAATRGDALGADLERSFYFSGAHLVGLGGRWLDGSGAPAFSGPTGEAWIALLKDFERAGPTELGRDDDLERFKLGRVGYLIESSSRRAELLAALGPNLLTIDPWPTVDGGRLAGWVQTDDVFLRPALDEPTRRAAAVFLGYFFQPEVQAAFVQGDRLPVAALSESLALADDVDLLRRPAQIALYGNVPYPLDPNFARFQAPLEAALRRALLGDRLDPATVLATADAQIRAALAVTPTPPRP